MPKDQGPTLHFAPCPWPGAAGAALDVAMRQPLLPPLIEVLQQYPELLTDVALQMFERWEANTTHPPAREKLKSTAHLIGESLEHGLQETFLRIVFSGNPRLQPALDQMLRANSYAQMELLFTTNQFLLGETAQMTYGFLREQMLQQGVQPAAFHLAWISAIARTIVQCGSIEQGIWEAEQLERAMSDPIRAELIERILHGGADPAAWDPELAEAIETALLYLPFESMPYMRGNVLRRKLEALLDGRYSDQPDQRELFMATFHEAEQCHTSERVPEHWAQLQIYAARVFRQSNRDQQGWGLTVDELLERLLRAMELTNEGPNAETVIMLCVELARTFVVRASTRDRDGQLEDLRTARELVDQGSAIYRKAYDNQPGPLLEILHLDQHHLRKLTMTNFSDQIAEWQRAQELGYPHRLPRGADWN